MHQYRIYTFREDGHFSTVRRIECTDQKQAVQEAQQLVEGEDSELWQGEHLIARSPTSRNHRVDSPQPPASLLWRINELPVAERRSRSRLWFQPRRAPCPIPVVIA